ncbi:MAG TPA: amidohydrolase family protein, partial [Dehalococcoidia bacterium]|nr:amidohydrolase family protein [Dehalococcoidia bacterium]
VDALEAPVAAAIARGYNDWLAEFCSADPSRLYGAALISLHDPKLAAQEARRAVEKLGFRGVFLRPNPVQGRNLHDPANDVFWESVQGLGVPVGFHEGLGPDLAQVGSDRFQNHLMGHMCSHPMELMMACLSLIAGGVLERFPRLTVAFLEGNCGWLPWWLWRMDEHYEWLGHLDAPDLTMKPSEYFARQCYISTDCDELPLRSVIAELGDDRIVFSTDYPHGDSKYPHAVETFLALPSVSDESKRKILWDNPARLYGLS